MQDTVSNSTAVLKRRGDLTSIEAVFYSGSRSQPNLNALRKHPMRVKKGPSPHMQRVFRVPSMRDADRRDTSLSASNSQHDTSMKLIPKSLNYQELGAAAQRLNAKPENQTHQHALKQMSPEETMQLVLELEQEYHLKNQIEKHSKLATLQEAYEHASAEQLLELDATMEYTKRMSDGIKSRILQVRDFIPVDFTLRKVIGQWLKARLGSAWGLWMEFIVVHEEEVARLKLLEPYVVPIQRDYRRFDSQRKARRKRHQFMARQAHAVTLVQALVRGCIGRADARFAETVAQRQAEEYYACRLQAEWRGHCARRRARACLRRILHDSIREVADGHVSRLDHLENLSQRENELIMSAIQMLDIGEGPPALEAKISQWQLKSKILEMKKLAAARNSIKQDQLRQWNAHQKAMRINRAKKRNTAALRRWELDKEQQREMMERRAMYVQDKEISEQVRLVKRVEHDKDFRVLMLEQQQEEAERENMGWEERATREVLRAIRIREEALRRNKEEYALSQKLREDKHAADLQAKIDHTRQLEFEAKQAAARSVNRKKKEAERQTKMEAEELRARQRRERLRKRRLDREKEQYFKKKMRDKAKKEQYQKLQQAEDEQALKLIQAQTTSRKIQEKDRLELLRIKWARQKKLMEQKISDQATKLRRQLDKNAEINMEKRECLLMSNEEQDERVIMEAEARERRKTRGRQFRMQRRRERMENVWMAEEEAYERGRADLVRRRHEFFVEKRRMAQRLEAEQLRKEETKREEIERTLMFKDEAVTRRVRGMLRNVEATHEAQERGEMAFEEAQIQEVWQSVDRVLKEEEDKLAERELRREWVERGKMGREEKWQRLVLARTLEILARRQESWEREIMDEEAKDAETQRSVELEGKRLLPLLWAPQETAVHRCLKSTDEQRFLTTVVRETARFLAVPMEFPLAIVAADTSTGVGAGAAWTVDSARNGETAQELKALTEASKTGAEDSMGWLELAQKCVGLFDATCQEPYILQAHVAFKRALQSVPVSKVENLPTHIEAARAYAAAGKLKDAMAVLGEIVTRHPQYESLAEVILRLAVILKHQEDYKQSRSYFVYLQQLGLPGWRPEEVLFLVSREYELEGNRGMAKMGYQQAYNMFKSEAKATAGAEQLPERWGDWLRDNQTWERMARKCLADDEYILAIDFLKQTLKFMSGAAEGRGGDGGNGEPSTPHNDQNPQTTDLWLRLAVCCQRARDITGARDAFSKVLECRPYELLLRDRLQWELSGAPGSRWKVADHPAGTHEAGEWVKVGGEGQTYYYNTVTSETRWERPVKLTCI